MSVEIPLFPLGVVLFPYMRLPLHIFEERYREMMRDCESQRIGFGVVAIRDGLEVGAPAVPHEVGTLAQLEKVERLEDGRYLVEVVGTSRYRIRALSTARPYLVAKVDYLQDGAGDEQTTTALAHRVATAFERYVATLEEVGRPGARRAGEGDGDGDGEGDGEGNDGGEGPGLPGEPELLSYLVAATLQVGTRQKQRLLEVDSAEDRLSLCLVLLRREQTLLDRRLARRDPPFARICPN